MATEKNEGQDRRPNRDSPRFVVQRPDGIRSKPWTRQRIIEMFDAGNIPSDSFVLTSKGHQTSIELFVSDLFENPRTEKVAGSPRKPHRVKTKTEDDRNLPPLSPPSDPAKAPPQAVNAAFNNTNDPRWYYQIDEEQYGPITMLELRGIARNGGLRPIDRVWKAGMPSAVPAAQIAGLFFGTQGHDESPSWLVVPLLVSAISNIVVGLLWASTCIGIVFTIPMIILCVAEFSLYSRVGREPLGVLARKANTIAICEIIIGLVNTPTMVCGIILKINAGKNVGNLT